MSTKREGDPTYDKAELDEPIFVLRAQDRIAPMVVGLYALACTTVGVHPKKVESVRRVAEEMRRWQTTHDTKIPD
jgi:hypothetical protein